MWNLAPVFDTTRPPLANDDYRRCVRRVDERTLFVDLVGNGVCPQFLDNISFLNIASSGW